MLSENTEGFTETNHEGCSWYCFGVFEFFLVGLQAIGSIKCWKDEASHNWTFRKTFTARCKQLRPFCFKGTDMLLWHFL